MHNSHITLWLFALLLTSACTSYLEDVQPEQSLDTDEVLTTASGLEAMLIGSYNSLQNSDYGANGLAINSSILSDNGTWRGSFPSYSDIFNRSQTVNNPEVAGFWREAYQAINQANLVLANVDAVSETGFTDADRSRLRGEALFLRGMSHFELVRTFAQPYDDDASVEPGVPIVLNGVTIPSDIAFPERSSVEDVYNQAVMDLSMAVDLLAPTGDPGRASSSAATAYLADIAFQQRNYEQAANLADIILNAGFSLTDNPQTPFRIENGPEEIFAVISTTQDNPGVNGSLPTFHSRNGRGGDVVVSADLEANGYRAIITPDQRAASTDTLIDLRFSELTSDGNFRFIEKYEDAANNADDNILARLPTYMLMRAEALVRLDGINEESIDLLNSIRSRAIRTLNASGFSGNASEFIEYEEDDFDNDDMLIEAIILERRVELAFENNRLNDLKRLRRDVRDLAWDDPMLVFPIPQREIDANSNLTQNEGY